MTKDTLSSERGALAAATLAVVFACQVGAGAQAPAQTPQPSTADPATPVNLYAANIGDNGAEATSGIQHSSVEGFDYSCNTPDLTNGLQLLYIPT